MSRSNGEFSSYVKLDIDPEVWPQDYWNNSRKCINCESHWPNTHLFYTSLCCNANTVPDNSAPDMTWREAVKILLSNRFDKWYEEYNEGVSDEQLAWEDIKTNGTIDESKVDKEINEFIEQVSRQPSLN